MPRENTVPSERTKDANFRMGAAALGMISGMAVGLAVAFLWWAAGPSEPSIATLVFGGAAAGAMTGVVFPDTAMQGVEAVMHFFIGMLSAEVEGVAPPPDAPSWLVAAFFFGVVYAIALWALV